MAVNEIVLVVRPSSESGYSAHALGELIHTQANSQRKLRARVVDAVRCHSDIGNAPERIRLQLGGGGPTS